MARGKASLTAQGLITFEMENGPMNLAFSLWHGDLKGRLRVESITLWPTLYAGAADRCLSACFLKAFKERKS